jgi:hypothetical protein
LLLGLKIRDNASLPSLAYAPSPRTTYQPLPTPLLGERSERFHHEGAGGRGLADDPRLGPVRPPSRCPGLDERLLGNERRKPGHADEVHAEVRRSFDIEARRARRSGPSRGLAHRLLFAVLAYCAMRFILVLATLGLATACGGATTGQSGGGDGGMDGRASDAHAMSSDAWGGFCAPDGGPAFCSYYTTDSICVTVADLTTPCWACGNEFFSACPPSVATTSCNEEQTCFNCGDSGMGQEYSCSTLRQLWLPVGSPSTCAK